MHVLLITTSYKSAFNEHSAPFFRDQAHALKKEGLQVGVLCPLPISAKQVWQKKSLSFKLECYSDAGVLTTVSPFFSIPKMPERTRRKRLKIGKILFKGYVEKNGLPDVIHVHTFLAGELAIWIKNNFQIPFVITEHSTGFARKTYPKKMLDIARNVFSESKRNIAVSKQFCDLLSSIFENKFLFIPNVTNTDFFKPKTSDKQEKNFVFLNVGFLDAKKNQLGLIKAFVSKFKGREKYKLIIVGGGGEYQNLKNEINENDVQNQIELYGSATREEVCDLMQSSDCFVLSSFFETFGVVLIEAMACGLPVISTRSGGPESIITNKYIGLLCENNEDALASAMFFVSNEKYSSERIRSFTIDNFSEKAVAKRIIRLYKECI